MLPAFVEISALLVLGFQKHNHRSPNRLYTRPALSRTDRNASGFAERDSGVDWDWFDNFAQEPFGSE